MFWAPSGTCQARLVPWSSHRQEGGQGRREGLDAPWGVVGTERAHSGSQEQSHTSARCRCCPQGGWGLHGRRRVWGQAAALTGARQARSAVVTLRLGQGLRAGWNRAPLLADGLRRVGRGPSPGLLPGLSTGGRPTWSAGVGGGGRRARGQPEREGGGLRFEQGELGLGVSRGLFYLWSVGNTDGAGEGRRAGSRVTRGRRWRFRDGGPEGTQMGTEAAGEEGRAACRTPLAAQCLGLCLPVRVAQV